MKFINISNHPMLGWGEKQIQAVHELGCTELLDWGFPAISPVWTTSEVRELVNEWLTRINSLNEYCLVHLMGETTFVTMLSARLFIVGHVHCVSTTERKVLETVRPDGTVAKTSNFEFVQFRLI